MRVGRGTSGFNWRYAGGELLLIVVGILIALAASDWQAARDERRTEVAALRELRASLTDDADQLEAELVRYRRVAARTAVLEEYLRARVPYADSLDTYFGSLYVGGKPKLNKAAYEALKSRGLSLVSNDVLRLQIARLYEQTYPSVEKAAEIEYDVLFRVLRPYYLTHFRNLRFGESATPLDGRAVMAGPAFLNLVDYRLQVTTQTLIPVSEGAVGDVRALIRSIDAELPE